MKIFDCFMFYDEEMLLDIRLHELNKFVDYFVIVESKFYHNGKKRNLKFQIKNYSKFKDKIIYIIHDELPINLYKIENEELDGEKIIMNALIRENHQRNFISRGLVSANKNDLILVSDVDEIPNLENFDFNQIKDNIILFEQEIFYYKLNRYLPNFTWYGTKGCKKKNLINPQWLRNIKNKRYHFFRLDTFFSNTKYINKIFFKNGGWHFSNLKNAENIELKLKSYLHHRDYEAEELGFDKISKIIQNNETIYDMFGDKTSKKYGDEKRKKLEIYDVNKLPNYIQSNLEKYKNWIDLK